MSSPHPVDIYVGKRLRMKRNFVGMSQETIGKQIGVTFQQIQKYERGINRMGASRLYDFAKAFGVQVSYFFEGFGDYASNEPNAMGAAEPTASEFEHEHANNREITEIVRIYSKIKSPSVRKRVIDLIKVVATEDHS